METQQPNGATNGQERPAPSNYSQEQLGMMMAMNRENISVRQPVSFNLYSALKRQPLMSIKTGNAITF